MKRSYLFIIIVQGDIIVVTHDVETWSCHPFQHRNDLPRLLTLPIFPVSRKEVSSYQKQVDLVLLHQFNQPLVDTYHSVNVRRGQNSH